ncbi:MAG: SH3 domain-containing protein [Armatimonadota bacterium]
MRRLAPIAAGLLASLAAATLAAGPPPSTPPRPAANPAEWKSRGWKQVYPHAYVIRSRAAARAAPEPSAPVAFYLAGGYRTRVLAQGRTWWRVSGLRGATGWMRAEDLEPHASWVFIDVATRRVTQRIAAKGQHGGIARAGTLWSVADTGITRTELHPQPKYWSYPAVKDQFFDLPRDGAWRPDGHRLYLLDYDERETALLTVRPLTGQVDRRPMEVGGLEPVVTGEHVALPKQFEGGVPKTLVIDPEAGRPLKTVLGALLGSTPTGGILLWRGGSIVRAEATSSDERSFSRPAGWELDQPGLNFDGSLVLADLYRDHRSAKTRYLTRILDAETLRPAAQLTPPGHLLMPAALDALRAPSGWHLVYTGDGERVMRLVSYDQGKRIRHVTPIEAWGISPDQRLVAGAGIKELVLIEAKTGRRRRVPMHWRRSHPQQYLPRSAPGVEVRFESAAVTFSEDGRTLIVAEYLFGDPLG